MRRIALQQLELPSLLQKNDVIGWPQGPGEPLALTEALVAQAPQLGTLELGLLFGLTQSITLAQAAQTGQFRFHALNGAGTSRQVTDRAEIYALHVSQIPSLLASGALPLTVAFIQVTPMPDGRWSTGVVSDFTQAMVRRARLVVALHNPALPAMGGDAILDTDCIDVLVEQDSRLIDMPDPVPGEVERAVASHVAALIPDRATVQLGIGTLPVAVAAALRGHRDLGVHSGVVSDVLVDLVEQGVVSNAFKGVDAGVTVTGGLFGTQRLRDFAASSGAVVLRNASYTHDQSVAQSLHALHTINSAVEVDAFGQVNAELAAGRYLGAVGGQVDFVRAGLSSPGGRSIIALSSATADGKHSRIVPSLSGRPVTTARSDVDVVVTEFGAAHLRGCSLQERVRRLAAIAHHAHRDAVLAALAR